MADEDTKASSKTPIDVSKINLPSEFVHKLKYPATGDDGQKVAQIKLRRPKVRDRMLAINKGGDANKRILSLLIILSEQDESVFNDMDLFDYEILEEGLGKFSYYEEEDSDG